MEIRLPCHIRPPSANHLNCPETSERKGMWRKGLGGNYIDTKTFNPHLKIISVLVKQWAFMKRVPYVCMELIQCDGLWVYGLDYKTLSSALYSTFQQSTCYFLEGTKRHKCAPRKEKIKHHNNRSSLCSEQTVNFCP